MIKTKIMSLILLVLIPSMLRAANKVDEHEITKTDKQKPAPLKASEKGNTFTVTFSNNMTRLIDYYFTAPYEPFNLIEEIDPLLVGINEEFKEIRRVAKLYKLDLPDDFWNCEVLDNTDCPNSKYAAIKVDYRFVQDNDGSDVPPPIKINEKIPSAEQRELQHTAEFGFTDNNITRIQKRNFAKLSLLDRALGLLHERMHVIPKVQHEYIMWYIDGLREIREIDLGIKKLSPSIYRKLRTGAYLAYRKLIGAPIHIGSEFKAFEYVGDNILIIGKNNLGISVKNLEMKLPKNHKGKLAYLFIDPEIPTENISFVNAQNSKIKIELKTKEFVNLNSSFVLDGNNNLVTILAPQTINGIMVQGEANTIITQDKSVKISVRGSNNFGKIMGELSITGNSNHLEQFKYQENTNFGCRKKEDTLCFKNYSYVEGDSNELVNSDKVHLIGSNNNIIESLNLKMEGNWNFVFRSGRLNTTGSENTFYASSGIISGNKNIILSSNFEGGLLGDENQLSKINLISSKHYSDMPQFPEDTFLLWVAGRRSLFEKVFNDIQLVTEREKNHRSDILYLDYIVHGDKNTLVSCQSWVKGNRNSCLESSATENSNIKLSNIHTILIGSGNVSINSNNGLNGDSNVSIDSSTYMKANNAYIKRRSTKKVKDKSRIEKFSEVKNAWLQDYNDFLEIVDEYQKDKTL